MYSEVFALKWSHVDLEAGTVRLDPTQTKNGEGRVIFLAPELRAMIERQHVEHQTQYRTCPFVFHRDGGHVKSIRFVWRQACKDAGLTGKIPHDFRRTAVRNMVRAGVPERVAMQLTGHRTRSVFERYNIVSDGDLRDAAKKLDAALGMRTVTTSVTTEAEESGEEPLTH